MVIVFDLDDTLYDERTYVESGFRAVAAMGAERFGWDAGKSFRFMVEVLEREGRGAVFDRWLAAFGRSGRGLVRECVRVYRHHEPDIRLYDEAEALLELLADQPLYLVTDGHKVVQHRKVEALGLQSRLRKVYITSRYGARHAKPSIHCFELLRARERCQWDAMVYVGDNPAKDFVNLNRQGMHTVRVLTGCHRAVEALPGHDARRTIGSLRQLESMLDELKRRSTP